MYLITNTYFEGNPVNNKKSKVYQFFDLAFNGESGDELLIYRPDINCYELR